MSYSVSSSTSALTSWYSMTKTSEDTRIARYVKQNQKEIDRANAEFESAVSKLKDPKELFEAKNYKLLNYILTAYGLESEIGNTGKLRKVVESDLTDSNSLANRMSDTRFLDLATALNFDAGGLTNIQSDSFKSGVEARYERARYQIDLGEKNIALRQAEYFKNNIGNISDIYSVLGDNTLRAVVTKVGGIPLETAVQSLETQAQVFGKQFDVSKAKDSAYVEKYIQRFLAAADRETNGDGSNDISVQLLQAGTGGIAGDITQIAGIDLLI
jgi:hypothetical protein